MSNRTSANILFVFALGISVCLLYSAEFSSFKKNETLGGLTCNEFDTVFSALSVLSNIQCALQCSRYGTCVVAFYKPSEMKCVGCNTTSKENMVTEDEYIGYVLEVTCEASGKWQSATCTKEKLPSDCKEILDKDPEAESGQYEIELWKSGKILTVNCDMETEGGGWTLFHRRIDGSVDFYRNFTEYENGFGNVDGELWIGLIDIQELAEQGSTEIRLDMTRSDGTTGHETCPDFMLTEGTNYTLNIGPCIPVGFKNMTTVFGSNNEMPFATYDRDFNTTTYNCAETDHGAWWYHSFCTTVNLNGYYATPGTVCDVTNATRGWCGHIYYNFDDFLSLRTSSMMIRRK